MGSKVALITGASRGVGFAAAKKIFSSFPGSFIYLTTKHQQVTADLNNAMRKDFGEGSERCQYIHLDIDNKDSVEEVKGVIGENHKNKLDILINNAGVYRTPSRAEFGSQARAIIGTNYFGLKLVMSAMRPMLGEGGGGRVVNMSSHLGHLSHINGNIHGAKDLRVKMGNKDIAEKELDKLMVDFVEAAKEGTWTKEGWPTCAYTVSKVGVNVYTRILQREFDLCGENITVNSLHPGTPHSKIHQTGVISLEEGAGAVADCAIGSDKGHRGQILWHSLAPVNWEDAVHRPSIINSIQGDEDTKVLRKRN